MKQILNAMHNTSSFLFRTMILQLWLSCLYRFKVKMTVTTCAKSLLRELRCKWVFLECVIQMIREALSFEKLEGEKCRKYLKPKAQWSTAQIQNQCGQPGTWSVKIVSPTIGPFLESQNFYIAVHFLSMTPKQPSVQAILMFWFAEVETIVQCCKDPHAVIKRSAQLNQ